MRPRRHGSWLGRLHFRTDLLPLDQALSDLVIVHELLHLCVPNHGRLWKALMHAHLGDWQATAERLPRRSGKRTSPSTTSLASDAIAAAANPAGPARLKR